MFAPSVSESAVQERIQKHVRDRTMSVRSVQAQGRENDLLSSSTWTRVPMSSIAERTCNQQLDPGN